MNLWMQCKVPTVRKLVVIATGFELAQFYLPAETEIIVKPEYMQQWIDKAGLTWDEVEWRDEPL